MMLGGIGLFRGIMAKMNWLDQNQQVVAQNVANANTPNYTPQVLKDVDFSSFMGESGKSGANSLKMTPVSMAATSEGTTIGATGQGYKNPGERGQKTIYEASPDGNGVILEEQLFKANKNSTEYQIATDLYRRNAGMIRMVLQGSGR